MRKVYTVGQVNHYIKGLIQEDVLLRRIYAKGEVSNCKYHTSGHVYFSLKDETGVLPCVLYARNRGGLGFRMCDGQGVIVLGKVDVYEKAGRYQLCAEQVFADGDGFWNQEFEKTKKRLADMGMFAPEYKQPIPAFARRVGIVTAPTGAAIRDIQNVAKRRNPYAQLILYPALVQGEGAAKSVARGIEALDRLGVDVILVGRGGGSIEDLWAFNEEIVAYAIFHCRTPVISCVGHETDFTIADFVADLRAPTPSAAAELAVADVRGILAHLARCQEQCERRMRDRLFDARRQLRHLREKVAYLSPQNQLAVRKAELGDKKARLQGGMDALIQEKKNRLALLAERLRGRSPLEKLRQGYAYVTDGDGHALTRVRAVAPGDAIMVRVTDGRILARVQEVQQEERERPWKGN